MALGSPWRVASPEYKLRAGAGLREKKASEFQMKLAGEQWKMQKDIYGRQVAAAGQIGEGLGGLVGQYNVAYDEARAANEARYQQMLGITEQTTGQRGADIETAYGGQQADITQRLARQGLGGTTIAPTMRMGVEREKQSSLNRLADQMQQTKLGIIERREDEYPTRDIIMQLVQALGQGGGGIGAGGIMEALGTMRQG